jgi:beta-glucosidase
MVAGLLCGWATCRGQQVCSNQQTPQQIEARIDALIAKMTIAERIAQLQDRAPGIERLGLPAYNWWNEGLHGLARDGYATVFPQAIGLAATWDEPLLHDVGDAVSTEARAKFAAHGSDSSPRYGGLTIWSPNINIFRDPRWGRGQETYGEDPFLTATLGTQFVKGMQGGDPFYLKADATPKHFAAHSGPEEGRDTFNAVVSPHDLADTYLPAFHALITTAHAAALMCSYNEIDGVPSCASEANLDTLVRKQWGFAGYVVSDCDAVGDISGYHHYARDSAEAAADALNAGVDLDCGNTYAALQQSLEQKLTSEAKINQALHRLLLARIHLGMLDPRSCTPYGSIDSTQLDSDAHRTLALRAAEESIVLLKNNGILPLRPSPQRKIAVIGPTADMLKVLEANYHGTALHPVTPLDGLRSAFRKILYAQGSLLAEGVFSPVPRNAFRLNSSAHSSAGLHADYFNTASIGGKPAVQSTVEKIDFDIDQVGFVPSIKTKHYAARWSGFFVPPAAGEYTLRVNVERCWDCTTHDSFRLFVGGKLVLDNQGGTGESDHAAFQFDNNAPQAIRLDYLHIGEDEGVALEWQPPADALLSQAVETAAKSDVIVAFVGLSPDLEGEALQLRLDGFNGGDRTSLDLPAAQRTLLNRLSALHKPLVVVLTSGSAVNPGIANDNSSAILEAWYPGEAGGEALASILSGQVNPSGRLPVTFYRSVSDLPAFTDYSMAHRTYRYYDGPVLYPFGFGLSYSQFTYSSVRLSAHSLKASESMMATVSVTNASQSEGSEVTELYVQPPQVPGAPRLMLRGIQRLSLKAGETRDLTFTLSPEQLSTVDASGARSVVPGTYKLFLGGAQPDLNTSKGVAFSVESENPSPRETKPKATAAVPVVL